MRYISAKKIANVEPGNKRLNGIKITPKGDLTNLMNPRVTVLATERNSSVVRSLQANG